MPDIRMMNAYRKSSLDGLSSYVKSTRHVSLLDLDCLELVDLGKLKKCRKPMKLNLVSSYGGKKGGIAAATACKKPVTRKVSQSGSSVNFSSLSRFSKLKSYVNDLSEKIVNVISSSFNLKKPKFEASGGLSTIGEETIGSYDIIEIEDIMETPSEGGRTIVKN